MFDQLGVFLQSLGLMPEEQAMQIASQMDAQGMPPPKGLMEMMKLGGPQPAPSSEIPGETPGPNLNLGSLMDPNTMKVSDKDISPAKYEQTPLPNPAGGSMMPTVGNAAMKLAAPIPMPGPVPGVTGGVKAPQETPLNPAIMQSLVQILMKSQQGQTGPSLGQLIR